MTPSEFFKMSHKERESLSNEQLESVRMAGAEEIITSARPTTQLKLRALQAKVLGISKKYKHPLVSAQIIYNMMAESALEMAAQMDGLQSGLKELDKTGKSLAELAGRFQP